MANAAKQLESSHRHTTIIRELRCHLHPHPLPLRSCLHRLRAIFGTTCTTYKGHQKDTLLLRHHCHPCASSLSSSQYRHPPLCVFALHYQRLFTFLDCVGVLAITSRHCHCRWLRISPSLSSKQSKVNTQPYTIVGL